MTALPPAAGPMRWREGVIERIDRPTPRVVSVILQAPIAPHMAGQHVDVRLTAPDGYRAQRSYSICSAPGSETIELAIERLDDGEVSPFFHEVAAPGDAIELRGPIGGHFVWRKDDGGPILLLAGGSGVAPLMAMVRHRAAVAPEIPALLIYSTRTWEEVIFREELLRAEAAQPQLSLTIATTRGMPRRAKDIGRRLDRASLREILATWSPMPHHVYVCGSNAFVEATTGALIDEAIPSERIRTERYGGEG